MAKLFHVLCFLTIAQVLNAQANTEVYLFDLKLEEGTPVLSNPKNISNNDGYDNQPSFLNDNTVLFSSTRADQTDIRRFDIEEGSTSSWITDTPTGSEYSPLKIPGKAAISAIRLDLDGLQRLYQYDIETGKSNTLIKDLKVGYHVWHNDHILVSSVLAENRLDLMVSNLKDGSNYIVQKNVGRCLLKIPNSNLISYISKQGNRYEIMSIDPVSGATKKIANTYKNNEDICWLNDGTILTGAQRNVLKYHPQKDTLWSTVMRFNKEEIANITRIAVNQKNDRLAFVAEESPVAVVQKQVETFNDRDLNGFLSCYSENVLVQRFSNDTMYVGKAKMSENYERFYANAKKAKVEVIKRIVVGNKVIDEEIGTVDGRNNHQVAIYEIKNGFIESMTFIFQEWETKDEETIVQEQLNAYNNRNIEPFMATYAEDIRLFNYPDKLFSEGQSKMKERYQGFFEATPDLNCTIKNRIVIGNKVIDEEYITANGSNFTAVAIYEVENGKIAKVTFLQ
ncbi:MAG: nuclear transport factor 2 family protein [Bacteroidota bacterium]